ncbi:MAG: carboxymuconolactone decarboxylase family protein [Planctomycetes bacterium]|nr:carboxymuconolactone decarboxylase family protein [Planctomycetota bacterium]
MDEPGLRALREDGTLDLATHRAVVFFAAAVADPELADLTCHVLADEDDDPRRLQELALQVYLFAGFPRCINVLSSIQRHFAPVSVSTTSEASRDRGMALFRRIYADQADRVLASLSELHPDLDHLILEEAYGRVLSRPGVDARTRELCAIVGLMVSNDERQWYSHLQGALRCGASVHDVEDVIRIGGAFTTMARAESARAMVRRIVGPTRS